MGWQGCIPSGSSRKESTSWPFPVSRGCPHSLALGPAPLRPPLLPSHLPSCLRPSSLPLTRTLGPGRPHFWFRQNQYHSAPYGSKSDHVTHHLFRERWWVSIAFKMKPNLAPASWEGPLRSGPAFLLSLVLLPSPYYTLATLLFFQALEHVKLFPTSKPFYCSLFLDLFSPSGLKCHLLEEAFLYCPMHSRIWTSSSCPDSIILYLHPLNISLMVLITIHNDLICLLLMYSLLHCKFHEHKDYVFSNTVSLQPLSLTKQALNLIVKWSIWSFLRF